MACNRLERVTAGRAGAGQANPGLLVVCSRRAWQLAYGAGRRGGRHAGGLSRGWPVQVHKVVRGTGRAGEGLLLAMAYSRLELVTAGRAGAGLADMGLLMVCSRRAWQDRCGLRAGLRP